MQSIRLRWTTRHWRSGALALNSRTLSPAILEIRVFEDRFQHTLC